MKRHVFLGVVLLPFAARAETGEIRCAQQYGLSYLALMMMEDGHLVEKQAKRLGLGDVKATWAKLGGPGAMNDALLSGGLDFATGGVPSLITLWAKTKGSGLEVRGVAALNDMPVELVVANPKIKSIKDFGPQDKIAVTTVKISTQALLLEMAAAKEFGEENYEKLDALTVSMPHPDALTALLSNSGGITAHFSSPPFEYQEKAKGMRAITSNYEILGGKATFNVVWATSKFKKDNPKAYEAFVAALSEATDSIVKDPKGAAAIYKRMSKTAESMEELVKEIADPQVEFTLTPHKTLVTAQFMHKIGRIKVKPAKWQDLYFEDLHGRPGS
ncbi:MAG: ABC transporter substrate-binding protein [Myxococcales bacterium]